MQALLVPARCCGRCRCQRTERRTLRKPGERDARTLAQLSEFFHEVGEVLIDN